MHSSSTACLLYTSGFEQGEHVVYHRLYDVTNITVISNKNTVGVYDMESQVKAEKRNADE